MNQKLNNRIARFQKDVNELKEPDVFMVSVGLDDDGDESIILSSSINNPERMLSGLAQLCAVDDGFLILFKSAVEIAESSSEEDSFYD